MKGLSFKRFLDIAAALGTVTSVVTDNDGDFAENITKKYKEYAGKDNIKIYASSDVALKTLEPQIAAVNKVELMNAILKKDFATQKEIGDYMAKKENKTDSALEIFSAKEKITYPAYVIDAISREK